MIVEFIGSTGAGKTTLFSKVKNRLAETSEVSESFDLICDLTGLRKLTHPTLKNLVGDAVGAPFLLRSIRSHKPFLGFVLGVLKTRGEISPLTINSLRSIIRSIGIHEFLRHREDGRIILVDEGTVLSAHNLFIYTRMLFGREPIARFASLAPLPDKLICIKAPLDQLVGRTLKRCDPPREMRGKDPRLIAGYTGRALKLFEQMVETAEIRNRVLVVENCDKGPEGQTAIADQIVRFILDSHFSTR